MDPVMDLLYWLVGPDWLGLWLGVFMLPLLAALDAQASLLTLPEHSMGRFVLYHPELGVYLGNALGLGFWSALDPGGQGAAVTFPDEDAALVHAAAWAHPVVGLQVRPVLVEAGCGYATVEECMLAGLPGWEP